MVNSGGAEPERLVVDFVRRNRHRVILGRLLGGLVDGLVLAFFATLAFGTFADSVKLSVAGWAVYFGLLALGLGGYLVRKVLSGGSLGAAAALVDERLKLRDRLSSALAFCQQRRRTPFMEAHLAQTACFVKEHRETRLPFPWPNRGRALALLLSLGLVSLLPHADRTVLQRFDQLQKKAGQLQAARSLLGELDLLRQEADLRKLEKLSEMLTAVEEDLAKQVKLLTPQELAPPPEPEVAKQAETGGGTARERAEEPAPKPGADQAPEGKVSPGVRLSHQATYQPVGKFDSFPETAYAQVFTELDAAILDDQLTGAELANLSEHVDDSAGKMGNFGYFDDTAASVLEAKLRGADGPGIIQAGGYDMMQLALAPLQYKSFSEFLKRYAAHLGDKALGKARFERGTEEALGGEMFNLSAPPPKDGKYALRGITDRPDPSAPLLQSTAEQQAQLASQAEAAGMTAAALKSAGGTQLGASGAGVGASAQTSRVPAVLPRAEGGEYLPLSGKLGAGESVVQVVNDRGRRNLPPRAPGAVGYREVFVHYARGAEAELNAERVPFEMRDYIREYFRSIRPELE